MPLVRRKMVDRNYKNFFLYKVMKNTKKWDIREQIQDFVSYFKLSLKDN